MSYCAYPEDVAFGPGLLAAFEAHVHENPLVGHLQVTGDGRPVKISDFLSQERFHALGWYCEFYRHVPVEHQIAIGLPPSGGRFVGIALNRGRYGARRSVSWRRRRSMSLDSASIVCSTESSRSAARPCSTQPRTMPAAGTPALSAIR